MSCAVNHNICVKNMFWSLYINGVMHGALSLSPVLVLCMFFFTLFLFFVFLLLWICVDRSVVFFGLVWCFTCFFPSRLWLILLFPLIGIVCHLCAGFYIWTLPISVLPIVSLITFVYLSYVSNWCYFRNQKFTYVKSE